MSEKQVMVMSATDTKYVFGVDVAKPGSERTIFRCPTCKIFQELVTEEYLCVSCAAAAQADAMLGIR